jgi:N utilization substance protein B
MFEPEPLDHFEKGEQDQDCVPFSGERKKACLLFHVLYAMETHEYEVTLAHIVTMFNEGFETDVALCDNLVQQAQAIVDNHELLDEYITPLLSNWRLDRIGICTRLILRMATWQLLNTTEPPKAVINEAIELAKCFSERDAYKFVNGVLDEVLRRNGKQEEH